MRKEIEKQIERYNIKEENANQRFERMAKSHGYTEAILSEGKKLIRAETLASLGTELNRQREIENNSSQAVRNTVRNISDEILYGTRYRSDSLLEEGAKAAREEAKKEFIGDMNTLLERLNQ